MGREFLQCSQNYEMKGLVWLPQGGMIQNILRSACQFQESWHFPHALVFPNDPRRFISILYDLEPNTSLSVNHLLSLVNEVSGLYKRSILSLQLVI